MSKHILLVTDSYPPFIGGAERDTQLIAKQLLQRGYVATVATLWQPGLAEEENDAGVHVFRLKSISARITWLRTDLKRLHHPPLPDPATVLAFRRLFARVRPDVVHTYGWISYACATALIGTQIPLVISIRDYSNICAIRSLVQQLGNGREQICSGPALGKCMKCASNYYSNLPKVVIAVGGVLGGRTLLRRRVQAVHTISEYVRVTAQEHLFSVNARHAETGEGSFIEKVIPCFRDEKDEHEPDRAILSRLPNEPFILYVGALRLIKGIRQLIEAYKQLVDPPPLVLLGTICPDTPKDFPPGIVVIDSVPHATVMAAWERSMFGVAPSVLPEPFGNVIHEGMSKGRAMIGTYPGGHCDQITDGETGILVPAGDVSALTEAMQRLIGDVALRERLGRAARDASQRFLASVVMPQFEELYARVSGEPLSPNSRSTGGR